MFGREARSRGIKIVEYFCETTAYKVLTKIQAVLSPKEKKAAKQDKKHAGDAIPLMGKVK